MALLPLLSITWLTLAAPQPPAPEPVPASTVQDIRVVLFVSVPKSLQKAIIEQIAIPVGQDIELVPMEEFKAAAKRAHVRHRGDSLKAAIALAHPLRLSHVVTIAMVQPRRRGHGPAVLEVFIGRLRPKREILSVQRYNLPNRKLTPSAARVIAERIKTQVQIPIKTGAKGGAESGSASGPGASRAEASKSPKQPPADASDLDPLTQDVLAEQKAQAQEQNQTQTQADDSEAAESVSVEAATNANHPLRMRGSLALTMVQRNAYLSAGVSGQSPPCYCGTGAFGNTFFGLHAAADLFLNEGLPGLGAMTELTLYWPHTEVQTDTQARSITSFVTDFRLALAYQWQSNIGVSLIPRAGWGLYDFPLSDGTFPGLSYSYPFLGLDVVYVSPNERWRLNASLDYLATLSPGEDAVRLGQQNGSFGLQVAAGVSRSIGFVELGLGLVFTKRSVEFSGQTFLFTEQTFDNVSLSDQQLQLLLSVGTHFW